jgi:hypothetical protein
LKRCKAGTLRLPFGVTTDECVDRLLTRYVFESANDDLTIEDAEEIICPTRRQATALANGLEKFCAEIGKDVHVSVVQDKSGWGVKAECRTRA